MRKFAFSKALLVCLAVLLFAASAFASAEADDDSVTVKLANKTDAKIFVALARISTGGDDRGDKVKGWYTVNPGKTRTVKFGRYSPVNEYFFYATSKSGKRVWNGNKNNDSSFWIHPKDAFDTHPDKKISGGKKVIFRHLNVSSDGKARVNFTVK